MPNAQKIAELSMLQLTEKEERLLCADIKKILLMERKMSEENLTEASFLCVPTKSLRTDEAASYGDSQALLLLSDRERDGYITVSRTVGGAV